MLGIGFLVGSYVLALELKRKNLNPQMASDITVLGVIFGISGAKILSLIEEWKEFVRAPLRMAFSPSGLTWYGGLALGVLSVYLYLKRKKVPMLKVWDAIGIGLMIGYGVARLGCHFAGDGDYGTPTSLPWGTLYYNGAEIPSEATEEYFALNPAEAAAWHYYELRSQHAGTGPLGRPYSEFDRVTPMHPTPVYEMILGVAGFVVLWNLRKKAWPSGTLFSLYLVLSSLFRFSVEFLRLNPRLAFGLSEAQLIAIPVFALGVYGMRHFLTKATTPST